MAHSNYTAPQLPSSSIINKYFPKTLLPTARLYKHAMTGPFPGVTAVVGGMTWARCSIFYGSDALKAQFRSNDIHNPILLNIVPSFIVSTFVQVVNMPLIRATITQQDPTLTKLTRDGKAPSTRSALSHLYKTGGVDALWHGTSAGLLKTVPKYVVSIVVKDYIGKLQANANADMILEGGDVTKADLSSQSFFKAIAAGLSGALLTNPADVIRNEMFKDNGSTLRSTLKDLNKGGSLKWMWRGVDKNLVAVAGPISLMIFLTDMFETFGEEKLLKRRITRQD